MKKFLVLEGKVHPEHYISDMDVTIPYQGEVLVPYEKAQWSRDLSQALHNKSVVKKRVVTVQDSETSLQKRESAVVPKPLPPFPSTPVRREEAKPSFEEKNKSSELLEKALKDNEHLRILNKELTTTTNKLLTKQDQLLDKLTEYLNRPVTQVMSAPNPSVASSTVSVEEDEDLPTFIPSKIRSGKAKASNNNSEVQMEAKEASSQLSEAASTLKALRKGKSNDD